MKKSYKSKPAAAVHEMMTAFHEAGAISRSTMREFDAACLTPVHKLSADEIKQIRESNHVSPKVFALHLHVSPLVISQWETGVRSPSGPALKLLTLVKAHGLDSIA